jgi:hypothetical protein
MRRQIIQPYLRPLKSGFVLRSAVVAWLSAAIGLPVFAQGREQPESTFDWGVTMGLGYFSFRHSLFLDIEPDPAGNPGDDWFEFYLKPWVSFQYDAPGGGTLHGKASYAYAKTEDDRSSGSGGSPSSSDPDDLYLAWSSGEVGGNGFSITGGRYRWVLGRQLLVSDGYSNGGDRGGYWSSPRLAWKMAGVAAYQSNQSKFELFYLERDEQAGSDTDTTISGINYERTTASQNWVLGVSWLETEANLLAAQRDGADMVNLRASFTPPGSPLAVHAEWVDQDNGDKLQANAWYLESSWQFIHPDWQPTLTYRYAEFEGDDPDTQANEAYDSMYPGFNDWSSWFQGEIAGGYFVGNTNLHTHMLRLAATPSDKVTTGLVYLDYSLDQTGSYFDGVESDALARELDWYLTWQARDYLSATFVLATSQPGKAIEEALSRTKSLKYGLIHLTFSF